jgi:hypothetical protein
VIREHHRRRRDDDESELVKRDPSLRSTRDDALLSCAIDEFPAFANDRAGGNDLPSFSRARARPTRAP